jgi:hypothetical protein
MRNNIFFCLICIGIFILVVLTGCMQNPVEQTTPGSLSTAVNPSEISPQKTEIMSITLIIGGYGYAVGDIVLIDKNKEPIIGDVVLYDCHKNKSYCMAFGPGVDLARIIGLSGDIVSFQQSTYISNSISGNFSRPQRTLWGADKFDVADMLDRQLKVPENELLVDRWIGQECRPGDVDEHGSSIAYSRYTLKREAITGVLIKKTGHDKEFEEQQKKVVY